MSEQTQEGQGQEDAVTFILQRIYLKDVSFESPRSPDAFLKQWKPRVNMEMNTKNSTLAEDNYEVVLSLTITAKDESDETVYLIEVQQAGIFLIKGMEGEALQVTLGSYCPNVLFPYAREAIDAIVTKGSFPPLMLAPVNFDAIYQQVRAQAEANNANVQ
ncbi:MAG: protein-export chaperone SecB [Pseudomonadales bacterium]|jgi:preprotein translocase subunit SecB|nr:protein-export chaperone SecB [Pseudomonadales bacterium]